MDPVTRGLTHISNLDETTEADDDTLMRDEKYNCVAAAAATDVRSIGAVRLENNIKKLSPLHTAQLKMLFPQQHEYNRVDK
jgi:hypothetical protein